MAAIESRWSAPIPNCSLQMWIFGTASRPIPDRVAFVNAANPSDSLTLRDYRNLSKRVALGLLEEGLKPGDRVFILSPNNVYFPPLFLGVLMAGGIVTGAGPGARSGEIKHQLKDSGASFIFVCQNPPSVFKIVFEAAKEVGVPTNRIFAFGGTGDRPISEIARSDLSRDQSKTPTSVPTRHWTELLTVPPEDAELWHWPEPENPKETTCCLNYSSGTTGLPKGVEISHYSYVANGVGVTHLIRLRPDHEARLKKDRALAFLPFYHAYGQTYFISILPFLGIPVYVMSSWSLPSMLEYIQKFRITILPAVPYVLTEMVNKVDLVKKYNISSLDSVGSGAAPLPKGTHEATEHLLQANDPNFRVRQGWGMTELTCTAMAWDPNSTMGYSTGVGEVAPNCKAKLMSLDGKTPITTPGTRGELWVSGPTLMRGYWRNKRATDDTIVVDADGTRWLKTGDIAEVDRFGPGAIFFVVDRIKELIKVRGNQVAPAELEGVLVQHPDIDDAGVIGVPKKNDECPRAYIVPRPGSGLTEKEVHRWIQSKLSPHKWLTGGVRFVDEIPRNKSGKIVRNLLREKAKEDMENDPNAPLSSKL
ncbi:uncharacterized protein CTHT_0052510 [Thermochaetoides thermophila DSM 1495]|uniref:Uncharacterized protein n=1 Tax=Chaetomium thermophilum (strain DSM 1495 / CBS 144.50 / IMI 039719) TaxID=759272 RepID=G0SDP5_CHATD|nr:hypothetical protein CTHT_0052510 [Thermochaetoides thermophila DSM 1495]EGS18646.1 hypothetical protein CTHT_0052510 [Thermochaetoides thermophila DSM 1495]